MRENAKKSSKKAGLPPGTLVHIGRKRSEEVSITVFEHDEGSFRERELDSLSEYAHPSSTAISSSSRDSGKG